MRKLLISTILFSFLLLISVAGASASAGKWKVPGDFATIQEAIDSDDVLDGDTIFVGKGNHAGAIVTKAVEIKGQAGAVINTGPLLTTSMPCGTIVLDIGFQFGFADDPPGSGATISHLKFEGVAFPVFSHGADDVTVTQNTMLNPIQGVTNWSGDRWEISHNKIIGLRTANGGGIGILIGDGSGGEVVDNVSSHNKISGILSVSACDGGGYCGTGIVLFADWRYEKSGATAISYNRVVKNNISLVSDNKEVVDVVAIELSEAENPGDTVICGNSIGFNDLRGTEWQIAFTPESLEDCNDISRNLGDNRGHGLHPSVFWPGGN
jgi:hypothetical protein